MSELFANPFARAVADGVAPRGPAANALVKILYLLVKLLVVVFLFASAIVPFVVLYFLFRQGIVEHDGWALGGGIAVVAMTIVMGLGRRR